MFGDNRSLAFFGAVDFGCRTFCFWGDAMIITFFGHSSFRGTRDYENKLIKYLEERTTGKQVDFYLGNYGMFDRFAFSCAKEFKKKHPESSLILISAYFNENTHAILRPEYDAIIYPELERVPPRYAILKRNEWMVKNADLIISYITHSFGGAYKACAYAKRHGKEISNLPELFGQA